MTPLPVTLSPADADTTVRSLIAAAGLTPDPDEIQAAVDGYPGLRASIARLYDVEIDHEEDLALTFEA